MRWTTKGAKRTPSSGIDPMPHYAIDDEVLPCPFCGSKAMAERSEDGFESVGCPRCNPALGVMVMGYEAVKRWNGAKR